MLTSPYMREAVVKCDLPFGKKAASSIVLSRDTFGRNKLLFQGNEEEVLSKGTNAFMVGGTFPLHGCECSKICVLFVWGVEGMAPDVKREYTANIYQIQAVPGTWSGA